MRGAKNWNNPDCFHSQENNPTENMLRLRLPGGKGWLETCGPTAAVNCLAAVGHGLAISTPGTYKPQPEEILSDCLNDPRNFPSMSALFSKLNPKSVPGNEVAEWYPYAVQQVFGQTCLFLGKLSHPQIIDQLDKGNTVQICLINPGHFVAVVAYDERTEDLIFHDSWTGRWPDGKGFCRRMTRKEFETNVKPKCLVYV